MLAALLGGHAKSLRYEGCPNFQVGCSDREVINVRGCYSGKLLMLDATGLARFDAKIRSNTGCVFLDSLKQMT